MSVEPTYPETNDETTARIPLTPPPLSGVAADPAGAGSAPGEPAAPDAPGAPGAPRADARDTPDAFRVPTSDHTIGNAAAAERRPAGERVDSGSRAAANDRAPVRSGPRTGPIVWGALILVFCGYVSQQVLGGGGLDAAEWITATIIGLGVLLLGVGFAVLIRSRRDTRRRP